MEQFLHDEDEDQSLHEQSLVEQSLNEQSLHSLLGNSPLKQSEVKQCLLLDIKKNFLKLTLKYLCDPTLTWKKVFDILIDAHAFYASLFIRIQNITKKNIAFYSREDIEEIDQILNFVINSKVPMEYRILSDKHKNRIADM